MKVDDSGKKYIRKFASVVKPYILIGIIVSMIGLAGVMIHAIKIDPQIYRGDDLLLLEHKALPYYTIIHTTVFFFGVYFYWKMSKHLARALGQTDGLELNRSFQALYQSAYFGLISVSLSLIFNCFDFYLIVKRHLI